MPKDFSTVLDMHSWLARIAQALVEASSYDDRAEEAWLTKVNDPSETIDPIADSSPTRF